MYFNLIVATDNQNGIAKNGIIPWKFSEDFHFFQQKTTETTLPGLINVVIMGRATAAYIGKPLKNRLNFVLSKTIKSEISSNDTFSYFDSLNSCLKYIKTLPNINNIFVCGGQDIYTEAVSHPYLKCIYQTIINKNYDCDRFFNLSTKHEYICYTTTILQCTDKISNETVKLEFKYIEKTIHPEVTYLELLNNIITNGHYRSTRNANTYSLFGGQLEFSLKNNIFPLLTTKKMSLRLIFEELMFFLRGQTDVNILQQKNVHIWNANTTQEFIDNINLPYKAGDMGPMYGFQVKHFGAVYKDKDTDYTNQGFDQLADVLHQLKTDPHSRRILMTMFNPVDAKKSVLTPCHGAVIQMYVEKEKYLCCHMYQRSSDEFLGAPFNIASYALFVRIICELVNNADDYKGVKLEPGSLIISLGDVHVYSDHLEAVKTQLANIPYDFPTLKFNKPITNVVDIEWSNIILENYKSHDIIKAPMIA
jgi:dihydrofolate reductase/thymidylate synthase